MKSVHNQKTDKYYIKIVEVSEDVDELYQLIKDEINKEEHKVFRSLLNTKRKKEWLSIRILLKDMLGFYSEIAYDNKGNPDIKEDYEISITHSKNIVGLILKKGGRTGIDSEIISERIFKTGHKFITDIDLLKLNKQDKLKGYYLHWCGKETIFKVIGGGGIDFKENLFLEFDKINEFGSINGLFKKGEIETSYKIHYIFIPLRNKELLVTWY